MHVGSSQDGEYHSSNCDIASQLLSLALVILASGQLKETLTITTKFFATTLSTLMVYSTEGAERLIIIIMFCSHLAFSSKGIAFICSHQYTIHIILAMF